MGTESNRSLICIYGIFIEGIPRYIGSTIDFHRASYQHSQVCYNKDGRDYNLPIYKFIRTNHTWSDIKFEILMEFKKGTTAGELRKNKKFYVDKYKDTIYNVIIPLRTGKEYYDEHRTTILQKQKDYLNNNKEVKDTVRDYQKNYQKDYQKQKIICEICSEEIRKCAKTIHQRSKFCQSKRQ